MSSSIPLAVPQFLEIATAALPATTQVWFGNPLPAYQAPITLEVLRVMGQGEVAELGPSYRREEVYDIDCQLTSWAGDEDQLSRMQECYTAWNAVEIAVANNWTLNGTVRFAQFTSFNYSPDTDARGSALGCLAFTVNCQQRVDSLD